MIELDGVFYSLNNRTLWCLKEAQKKYLNLKIRCIVVDSNSSPTKPGKSWWELYRRWSVSNLRFPICHRPGQFCEVKVRKRTRSRIIN